MNSEQLCIRAYADKAMIRQCIDKVSELDPLLIRLAQVLTLAGNENRLKIIYLLKEEPELCVCDLGDILGISIPAVSQHLRKLKDAGLIQARKLGQTVFYSLRAESTEVLHSLLNHLETLPTASLQAS